MGGGEGGQEGGGMGRVNLEGATGRGDGEESNRDGKRVAMGGIQREEEMERGAVGKGGKMGTGRGERGKRGDGEGGGRRGKRREDFTDGYDGMPGWT